MYERRRGTLKVERNTWCCMRQRCLNPKSKDYKYYGGRGITVCQRWRESFQAFYADMGDRPDGMTLDRVDNDAGYSCGKCPECERNGWVANCRWADKVTQMNNRRHSISTLVAVKADLIWCLRELRGLGHPATNMERKYSGSVRLPVEDRP